MLEIVSIIIIIKYPRCSSKFSSRTYMLFRDYLFLHCIDVGGSVTKRRPTLTKMQQHCSNMKQIFRHDLIEP